MIGTIENGRVNFINVNWWRDQYSTYQWRRRFQCIGTQGEPKRIGKQEVEKVKCHSNDEARADCSSHSGRLYSRRKGYIISLLHSSHNPTVWKQASCSTSGPVLDRQGGSESGTYQVRNCITAGHHTRRRTKEDDKFSSAQVRHILMELFGKLGQVLASTKARSPNPTDVDSHDDV